MEYKKNLFLLTNNVLSTILSLAKYQIANENNVYGWVKNKNTNEVEAVLIGDGDCVDSIIKLCEKGPSFSNVTNIKIQNYQQEYHKKSFDILHK